MTIDADGSPRAYGPRGTEPLDYLGNAGHPGNWWGLATDGHGKPFVQGTGDPCPGYYVSTTAYQRQAFGARNPRRYLDSETVPFIVVPLALCQAVGPVVLGCRATVTYREKTVEAMVGDIGPATHLGEASIAVAKALGINADPKTGGSANIAFEYTIYPGQPARIRGEEFPLQPL